MSVPFRSAAARTVLSAAVIAFAAACGAEQSTAPASEEPQNGGLSANGCVRESLAIGQGAVLGAGQTCVELLTAGSRYEIAVVNASRAVGGTATFEVVGTVVAPSGDPVTTPVSTDLVPASGWSGDRSDEPLSAADESALRRGRAHQRILDATRAIQRQLGPPKRREGASGSISASPATATPSLDVIATTSAGPMTGLQSIGDTATLRIPDINSSTACRTYLPVLTRVVHTTEHAVLVEDVLAPLAGRMDSTYQRIGQEFEQVMWPLLTANFGNPLRMDAKLDGNGRILMLFSPTVNEKFTDIAGFVIGCDFYPRSQAPSSNEGEVFYATVPTSLTGSLNSSESLGGWLRTMRSTILHESKHITAYAERLATNVPLEEAWLEEGTARIAEELYARALTGGVWKGNMGYSQIACEVRPANASCVDRPYVMYKHFDGLYDFLVGNGSLTPLGQTTTTDYNYYASAWSLVRWAADRAPSEAAFLQALTRGPAAGVANLEAVSGRPWPTMLADWTLALSLDDLPGFAADRDQSVPTWNLRGVFAGMNQDFPSSYTRTYPLQPASARFGAFSLLGPALRGGGGTVLSITGAWAGTQTVKVQLPGGGAPATTLRLAVTRVQ